MDSGVDEELNYEEDELENDESCKDSENMGCTQDSVTNNSNLEFDDQYLQIDYLDDENLAEDAKSPESVPTTPDNDEKEMEKNESTNQENASTNVQKEVVLKNSLGDDAGTVPPKRKRRVRHFQRRAEFKKKLTKSFCLNPWLPEYNLLDRQHHQFLSRTPMLNSFPQQSNILTANLLGQPFNSDGSGYQVQDGQALFSRSFGYKGFKPDAFSKDISNSSGFDQNKNLNRINHPYVDNFQTNPLKNGYNTVFYNGNTTNMAAPLSDQESKFFPQKSEDGFINSVQYKSFQEEEKKVLMMKKEARLKRFMQDDLIKKDKLTDSGFEEFPQNGYPPKVQLLENKEKKFIVEEPQKNLVSCNEREALLEKPDINKELLLRKKNPFGGNLGTSNFNLAIKGNQNEKIEGVKVERVDTKPCMTSFTCPKPMKTETKASIQSFVPIKTETESQVKFIRTVSKTFDELTFKKPKTEVPDPQEKVFPFVCQKIGESFPKQLEPQLTGCIVKVLNIPPSTTTNDILALCSPVGIVMELKLNCPKENSVVIRFAEPKLAEKFFSLYHGQKMNNYFLNVIVV